MFICVLIFSSYWLITQKQELEPTTSVSINISQQRKGIHHNLSPPDFLGQFSGSSRYWCTGQQQPQQGTSGFGLLRSNTAPGPKTQTCNVVTPVAAPIPLFPVASTHLSFLTPSFLEPLEEQPWIAPEWQSTSLPKQTKLS